MNIILLHYTYAPLIGGVENILEQHAALLTSHGHEVTVVCSEGASANPAVQMLNIPELRRDHPLVHSARSELDAGKPGDNFAELKNRIAATLSPLFVKADIVFLHNVLTMPFHPGLTAALWRLTEKHAGVRFVAWTHDIAACNPDYSFQHLDSEPWNLLTKANPHVEYVAISRHRKEQFLELTGAPPKSCTVIPNGIDAVEYLGLTDPVAKFVRESGVLNSDVILLHPTRILKRKNIELGIRVIAAMKAMGKSCSCIVTGPPDLFNTATAAYYKELLRLRRELAVEAEFIFLHELFAVTNRDLSGLYRIADVLFYPSKQEGFGLPILEGALHEVPIVCAGIEPMKSLALDNTTFFEPGEAPAAIAEKIIAHADASPLIQSRKAVLRDYSWDTLYSHCFKPLMENQTQPT